MNTDEAVDNRNPLAGTLYDDAIDEKSEISKTAEATFNEEDFAQIFGDTAGTPSTDSLQRIAYLVDQVQAQQASIILWEEKIIKAKEHIRLLLEVHIPDAMAEVGMQDIGLADGTRVKVEPFHRGSITEKTKAAAHAWLDANGFGGLIKREVNVSFGRDDDGVDGLRAYIRETGLACKEKEAVHAQTLGAFIRNQAEKAEPVPADLFNVYSGNTTKFTKFTKS